MASDLVELALRIACIGTGGPILAAALAVGMRQLRRAAIRRAEERATADRSCAACGEREVPWDEDDVYLCPSCGYEGGTGLAARDARRRREQLLSLPLEERHRLAREALTDAIRLLDVAEPELQALRGRLTPRREFETTDQDRFDGAAVSRALGWTAEAFAWLDRAAACLDTPLPTTPPDVEPEMWIDQLGQVDLSSVVADLDRALEAVDRGRVAARALTRSASGSAAAAESGGAR